MAEQLYWTVQVCLIKQESPRLISSCFLDLSKIFFNTSFLPVHKLKDSDVSWCGCRASHSHCSMLANKWDVKRSRCINRTSHLASLAKDAKEQEDAASRQVSHTFKVKVTVEMLLFTYWASDAFIFVASQVPARRNPGNSVLYCVKTTRINAAHIGPLDSVRPSSSASSFDSKLKTVQQQLMKWKPFVNDRLRHVFFSVSRRLRAALIGQRSQKGFPRRVVQGSLWTTCCCWWWAEEESVAVTWLLPPFFTWTNRCVKMAASCSDMLSFSCKNMRWSEPWN